MKKALLLVCITALVTLSGCKLTNWFCGSGCSEKTETVEKVEKTEKSVEKAS